MSLFEIKLERPEDAPPRMTLDAPHNPPPKTATAHAVRKPLKPAHNAMAQPYKPTKIPRNRRPSIEIAQDFVELNLKTVIDIENEPKLTRAQKKEREKQEKQMRKYRFRGLKIFVSLVMLLILVAGVAASWWQTSIQAVNPKDTSTRRFEIAKGATTDQVAESLYKAGFIRNVLAFRIYARWTGNIVQAGTHMLSPSYTLPEISKQLTMASTEDISIQIPPGLSLKQLRDTFKRNGFSDAEIDRAYNAKYDNEILKTRPTGTSLEGFIFPDTYRISPSSDLEELIGKAIDKFEEIATENELEERFAAQGLSFYQGLTLASIVELEVTNSDDQKLVASVFYNRLDRQMSLGSDVTYLYAYNNGLCDIKGPACDSVYNTRKYFNLPPTPIANVNTQVLIATANPAHSGYLFFVAGYEADSGGNKTYKTYFSKTESEHEHNVALYCHELCWL
ncbi:endolytic transglycosylase MltG [Candidatus Saccharibacteria bacterium]|nr:endolytic transglycosylase MltG [Candidatus Saccharibacteria bacterium]MCL1963408.1 endolytic transglycosylase MltG [Candidatus Saccharibacteria bacterium]